MSATRDMSQKIGWSYSNIYRIYKDNSKEVPTVHALEPIKDSLQELNRLHGEIKDMIDELETIVKG